MRAVQAVSSLMASVGLLIKESALMDVSAIVKTTVTALGFELVDFERGGGMFKVFIDKAEGITVEDCAAVSNQLTRVFMVENIDFERLEVSSPGLDRPLKTIADFEKFIGVRVKVRLHEPVDARKRFDGAVLAVDGDKITFDLADDSATVAGAAGSKVKLKKKVASKVAVDAKALAKSATEQPKEKRITVALSDIERARLIPDI
jgi:ribosome maturation factor RimP